jgi:hypothetical protein
LRGKVVTINRARQSHVHVKPNSRFVRVVGGLAHESYAFTSTTAYSQFSLQAPGGENTGTTVEYGKTCAIKCTALVELLFSGKGIS